MSVKGLLLDLTPPAIARLALRLRDRRRGAAPGLSGDYATWEEAKAASSGYGGEAILEKTRAALLRVRDDAAIHERDSVLFDAAQYSWPVLAGLLWAAARSGGRLNVLDFGGSLGSSFFQHRVFLRELSDLRWNIVEQPAHVAAGRTSFEDGVLKFYGSIAECVSDTVPNVALLSGVLQYLERPYDVLASLLALPCRCVIVDRTPFWDGDHDRVGVQRVDPRIFDASLPAWVFSRRGFDAYAAKHGSVVAEFDAVDNAAGLEYKGFILRGAGAPGSR